MHLCVSLHRKHMHGPLLLDVLKRGGVRGGGKEDEATIPAVATNWAVVGDAHPWKVIVVIERWGCAAHLACAMCPASNQSLNKGPFQWVHRPATCVTPGVSSAPPEPQR